jgi:hypothetical protein
MTNDYMVVLEFSGDDLENYDCVVALETRLEAELESGEIDGHDEGRGIVNVFINTKNPKECFKEAMKIMKDVKKEPDAAGCRKLDEEEYVRLWPEDDPTRFELK